MLVIDTIREFIIKKLPNLAYNTELINNIILIILIYIFASIVMFIIYKILKDITDSDSLKLSDQILGFLYGLVKSTLVVMLLVYFMDKGSDYIFTNQVKDSLSSSNILPLMYTYNIFLNMF